MKQVAIIVVLIFISFYSTQAQNINHPNVACPMGINVNPYNGNLYLERRDLYIEGRKIPINLTFYYSSTADSLNIGYGNGWSMEYLMRYEAIPNGIRITRGDAYQMDFALITPASFKSPTGVFDNLSQYEPGKYVLITKQQMKYFFDDATHRRLTKIEESNGNFLNFTYITGLITQITDKAGRSIQLTYADGKLSEITDALATPVRKTKYKYDDYGNLTEAEDPLGNKFKYAYLINGPLRKLTDKNGTVADIIYSSANSVKEVITCITNQRFSYNKDVSQVVELVSGQNQITTYRYNSKGYIIQKHGNCCGFNTKYEYDNDGNISKFTDANGHASVFTYDSRGNMLSKTDVLGNTLYLTYNDMSIVQSLTDKNGNITSFMLDGNGNVTTANYPENVSNQFTYATNGDLISSKDGNNNITTYNYDNYGNPIAIHKSLGVNYTALYDARSRLITVTDPNGNNTFFNNDLLDRIDSVTDAAGHAIKMRYDANGNIISYKDRNGNTTTLAYDAGDRLVSSINALSNSIHAKYDEHNNLTAYTDENGHTTKLTYDELNRLIQVVNAANEVTQYAYEPTGKLSNMIYPNENNVSIKRDARDKIIQISDNIGTISQRQYDAKGNLLAVTNALGNTTNFMYDRLNRLIKRTDPLNFSEEYTYDKNFNILSFKDKNGHSKYVAYNALNRVESYTDALGFITIYTYDLAGNLTEIEDAKQNKTNNTYDILNRQTSTAYAIGPGNSSTYDNNGNVSSYKDGNGITTLYEYDAADQLTKMDFPGVDDYLYTYDAAGNLRSATNADAIVNFEYDQVNRIVSEKLNGRTTGYIYNILSGSFTMNYPSGRRITKSFDARNRLIGIIESNQQLFSALYDGANQMTTQTNGNGEIINYSYDQRGRLLSKFSNSIPSIGFQYTYDNARNKLSELKTHKPDHSEQYIYDNEDQLLEFKYGTIGGNDTVRHQKFAYDRLGNRITALLDGNTVSYVSNALNQYTSVNGAMQTFDSSGNLASSGGSTYNYNPINQLVSVNTIALKYDALNRLIKIVTPADSTIYNYSFFDAIEIKKSGNDISNVFGNGLDDLTSLKNNGQQYFATQNNVNSVTSITDSTNHLREYYEHDPFGTSHIFNDVYSVISNSAIGNELQFGGRNNITSTGLYNFRFRYLNTQQGRFIQRDPLKYINGMNNLSFVNNNSINNIDPLGLWYIDINVSGGFWVGATGGVIIGSGGGIYPYVGGGFVTPGVGGSVTWSPQDPSTGWNVGLQGTYKVSAQGGYSFKDKSSYWEVGGGGPLGISATGFYVFDPGWNWKSPRKGNAGIENDEEKSCIPFDPNFKLPPTSPFSDPCFTGPCWNSDNKNHNKREKPQKCWIFGPIIKCWEVDEEEPEQHHTHEEPWEYPVPNWRPAPPFMQPARGR